MEFTNIEKLQLEAMGYTFTVDARGDEVAKFASGSICNYKKEIIFAGWRREGYSNDDVFYMCHFEDFSETGGASDHSVEGRKYVNIDEMYKQYKLAEEEREARRKRWEEMRKRAWERARERRG